jgi:hypothetical protein
MGIGLALRLCRRCSVISIRVARELDRIAKLRGQISRRVWGQRRWPRSPARIELDIDAASDGVVKREQTHSRESRQSGGLDPTSVGDPASRNLNGLRLPATTEATEALFLSRQGTHLLTLVL